MRDLRALSANVLLVSKRRGQLNQAIKDTVAACIGFVERLPRRADRLGLIQTLKAVTGAHIFVEVERARVTRMLSLIQEGEGKIAEASETLQEVQVETFGSMDKREKTELILEQMRLCMRQRDFVRMGIIANKINKKVLDEAGFEALKLRFLRLMALLAHSRHDAPALAKGAFSVLETRGVKEDEAQWRPALASAAASPLRVTAGAGFRVGNPGGFRRAAAELSPNLDVRPTLTRGHLGERFTPVSP